jgi:D-amino peptidase
MKILLSTDMEGCAGILNHDDWVIPQGRFYLQGRRILTEETNAAVAGFFEAGATAVTVIDGHGAGGIDPELLDERAELCRGPHPLGYLGELDGSYAALAFVGQHAKAGTPRSHITHTGWFNWIDESINGISVGEYGQSALVAMELGVPTIFAAGEEALAKEAQALTPGVVTVAVKRGLQDDDGMIGLDTDGYRAAKLGAVHLAPARARQLIRQGACQAIRQLNRDPGSFGYPAIKPPYVRLARFRRKGDAPGFTARDTHPSSLRALVNMPYTPVQ